ncbi:hypothetical protein [Mucilaginibacter sp.]|uniref:hypothetical protein n=1 Tax=Mucilaginibacter sp. TaxID=1882438 RepID=UPI00326323AC
MKRSLLPLLLCFVSFAFAQAQNQPFLHQRFDAEFTAASTQTSDGKYYQSLTIPFDPGDAAFIVYRSGDFSVLLGVQDTLGRISLKQDERVFSKTTGSGLKLPFRPPFAGIYRLLFSTKDKGATGKFSIDLYLYRKGADRVRNTASTVFGDKLQYLQGQKFLGYEFVKLSQSESFMGANFVPTVKLFDDAECKIEVISGSATYACTFPTYTDLAAANAKFDALQAATRSILPVAYGLGVNRADNFTGKTKEHFVRGVVFTETGRLPYDVDPMQKITNIKHMVTISLNSNKPGEYTLTYDLD